MLKRFLKWLTKPIGCDERGLFLFHDSQKWRTVDGLETLRAFFLLPQDRFDWDTASDNLKQPFATVQVATIKRISDAVREVFNLPPSGLTETECVTLLNEFRGWIGDVKKNTSLYPISPDSTESNQLDPLEIPPPLPLAYTSIPTEKSPADVGLPPVPTSTATIP
jgi:hypothetical protein